MAETENMRNEGLLRAFRAYEAEQRVGNTMVGCVLVVTLMPAGSTLDFFVYRDQMMGFLALRLICAAIAGGIWFWLWTGRARNGAGGLGLVVPMLPVVFIAAMIALKDGFDSPYYAGLNLVLLAIGAVLHWTVRESVIAVVMVLGVYVVAGVVNDYLPGEELVVQGRTLFNNFYFIVLMDVIVVVGTYFQSRQRLREFSLRFQLDQNKRMLEENHQKLVELDQVKSRFFANISHELRTPLTLLLAPLETLLTRYGHGLGSETRELLLTMQSNGMRLLKLINDLLDLVRLESGTLEVRREPLEVGDFLRGLVSAARQVADDKRLTLRPVVAPEVGAVMADRDKLEKVLLNLQFNALKFTPAGGTVELRADREGDQLVLKVIDTGMGISPDNLPHVFDRFWQADGSSKRKYQGVGIGLSLVKELVEAHGGTVTVESEIGKGTSFTIRLPYEEAEKAGREPEEVDEEESVIEVGGGAGRETGTVSSQEWLSNLYRRAELFPSMTALQDTIRPVETGKNGDLPTVLIADDEPDMLRFLKSQLTSHYRVLEAVDGQQAVDKGSQFLPDIILLDMMMPEKDGLQACRELRERTSTQSIPVILLTARADEETKLAALAAGANDFLPKPFSTTELHVRIKNLVESLQYQQRLARQNGLLESTIEQLKESEIQLVQNEKLVSLGRMSAGIIHEINNPLNFATTGLYSLREKARFLSGEEREDYDEVLKDVEEGITRVKTIVSDLRTFSHHRDEDVDRVDVTEVVESALRFLSPEWKQSIRLEKALLPEQSVDGNRNKLIQVMVNLLQNAVDAMKDKVYEEGEQPTLWIESEVEGGRNRIRVRDNGPGIDDEHRDKIFDPFYTTKDVGEGMGLGLSICYKIVSAAGGAIEVKSEPGRGSEFILTFPEQDRDQ